MPAVFALWVCWCAYFNCVGWALSAVHQLTAAGYIAALTPGLVVTVIWLKQRGQPLGRGISWRRFRRPLPAIFLFCTGLIFLGAILYAPSNYDALTYRLPRMLNWWTAGQWHWLAGFNHRMNYSGTGWEWTAMPLLVLTHSDRAFFLVDALGFLLLPGLLFAVFRQLGVRHRVAWTWMWVLPLGYGYATQAGSVGNDILGMLFCLAAVYFGLRARKSGQITDVWLTVMAAALMTAVKLSNLPLGLPCLVAVWPALGLLRKQLIGSLAVAVISVTASALPIMALNQLYAGSWTGDPNNRDQMQIKSPTVALLGNSFLLAEQAFMPPMITTYDLHAKLFHLLPTRGQELLREKYPRFRLNHITELPTEENAGLGAGITLLLLAGIGITGAQILRGGWRGRMVLSLVAAAAWGSTAVYLLKMGSEAAPRLMLSYYPLAIVPFLGLSGQDRLLRRSQGRWLAVLAALAVLPALIFSVSRPLWPAVSVSTQLAQAHQESRLIQRMANTYETYSHRNDLLGPMRAQLPASVREIGIVDGVNDTDYSLWRPFGERKVIYLLQPNGSSLPQVETLDWLVVKEGQWPRICPVPLTEWARQNHFKIVFSPEIAELVSWGPEKWYLLQRETSK